MSNRSGIPIYARIKAAIFSGECGEDDALPPPGAGAGMTRDTMFMGYPFALAEKSGIGAP